MWPNERRPSPYDDGSAWRGIAREADRATEVDGVCPWQHFLPECLQPIRDTTVEGSRRYGARRVLHVKFGGLRHDEITTYIHLGGGSSHMALQLFGDERMLLYCAFCGGGTGTRDHCPSRVFLDPPLPDDLPVVPACRECNASFSADEQYLACLLSCVLAGSADPDAIERPSIKKTLEHSDALRVRIENSRSMDGEQVVFTAEQDRVNSVITKLAQGHALYELHEPRPVEPDIVWAVPLTLLSEQDLLSFERPDTPGIWPEVGSRAMQRLIVGQEPDLPWIVVQPGMYRYLASPSSGTTVHIVIQEYLAGYVHWD